MSRGSQDLGTAQTRRVLGKLVDIDLQEGNSRRKVRLKVARIWSHSGEHSPWVGSTERLEKEKARCRCRSQRPKEPEEGKED